MIRKLFNNRLFIIGLALCSGLLIVRSVATPFLSTPDFGDVEAPEYFPEEDGPAVLEVVATVPAGSQANSTDEDRMWRAEQSVLSGRLTWNEVPRRDPFSGVSAASIASTVAAPSYQVPPQAEVPRLDALVAGPDSLFAVLNDQIVREGDLLGPYRIVRIAPDGVRIASRSASHWLAVADMAVWRPVENEDEDVPGGMADLAGPIHSPEPGG